MPDTITPAAEKLYQKISELSTANDKRVFVLTRATEPIADVWYEKLDALRLTFTGDYRKSLRALGRLRKNERDRAIGRFQNATRSPSFPNASIGNPEKRELDPRLKHSGVTALGFGSTAAAPTRAALESGVLSYAESEKLLQSYGIPLTPAVLVQSAEEAVHAAETLGYPCVLKVASIDIAHKTELGALRLGLENRAAVQKAYDEMLANVRGKKPEAKIEGVLVQKQIGGIECLLGIARDDQLGPILVMGLGGVFVEILADVAIRIPPISAAEARRALESLKGKKVFSGVRGASPADIDALAEMAARLSWLACDLRDEIAELDLNPVMVLPSGQGAIAVDALIVTR